ncbi:receptor-like serine/threonine-protein kinase At2g45590 [Phragmites australis]|uniref:receptor-like serine/threonine-protein kinase At2g45590 n=1 Tax=Phragmites australis TaxID=29695 RepID=UPI002D798860|nr:receptor-like serine/threonine-protein kinase At2g45590 [Phragmites australis]
MPSRQPPPPSPSPSPAAAAADAFVGDVRSRGRRHPPVASAAAAGASAAAAALILVAFVAVLLWRMRRGRKRAAGAGTGAVQPAAALRRLSYQQLRRATGFFAAGSKLGQGGFGPVFRGALPRSGQPVAVKVMDAAGSLQGEREFHNELSLASHLLGCAAPAHGGGVPSILLPFAYSLSAQPRRRRMMLVYELMPNGSLQDALLGKRCPELVAEWPRRLAIARDVAAALHYLHSVVQPPVIHGDVKPSNVLLDGELRARLADFGLARIRSEEEEELESGAIGGNANGNGNPGDGCDDDVSVAGESTAAVVVNGEDNAAKSLEDDEAFTTASPAEAASTSGCDKTSVGSGFNGRSCNGGGAAASGTGSDWWWRQDNGGGGGGGVKDYVMEWIRSEIKKERPKSDWIAGSSAITPVTSTERKKPKRRAREWWREEYAEELTKKQKRRMLAKSKSDAGVMSGMQWWERDCDLEEKGHSRWRMMKSWSRRSSNGNGSIGWWVDGVRRSSRDWASGEFVPKSGGAVSSTPSMRGTVCYVAPEYGGGGPLSEKCDIYSFGVLLLVLISGRRPLQMTTSPMSDFEKASLISWARHLAQVGRLLDLVDPALRDVDRDQALLCITVALLCIQRSPARRPSSTEVLEMLAGEGEPPRLPIEFSPSPPGGFPFKSRKKGRRV